MNDSQPWTTNMVWAEVVSAAQTSASLAFGNEAAASLSTITPDIARLRQVQSWMSLISPEERDVLWDRAKKQRWKQICWHLGISRPTANRRRERVLMLIAAHLRETGHLP